MTHQLDLFWSFRSPYSYLVTPRLVELERDWDARVNVRPAPLGLMYRPQAPRAVALRVLARIVRELDGEEPRGSAVARLFDRLLARDTASIGNLVARATLDGWSFTKAPQRRG